MFGAVKRKSSPREYPGVGNLAAFILSPTTSPKGSKVGVADYLSATIASNTSHTTCETDSADGPTIFKSLPKELPKAQRTMKTGDANSYWLSSNDNVYLDRRTAVKGYRVVSYRKMKRGGKRVVFDILDGKPYYCGVGVQKRITENAIVFATKEEALSERFPSNQFEGTKSGNGVHPRVLIAFDVWGKCKKRHGGVPSMVCENVRFLKIVEFLDPPHPRVTRLVKRNVMPHMFPGPDTTAPTREATDREVKIYRMFNLKKKVQPTNSS